MAEPIFNIPGVSDWIAPRRNALLGLASGLAGGRNLSQGLGMGFQNAAQGAQADSAYAIQQQEQQAREQQLNQTISFLQEKHPDLAAMVQSGMPVTEAWGTALKRMEPNGGAGAPSYGLTPVFVTDDQGNQQPAQMSSTGGILINGELMPGLPQGWNIIARPENLDRVDLGGSMGTFNPNTGAFGSGPVIQGAPSANMDVSAGPGGRVMAPAAGSPEARETTAARTKATSALTTLEAKNEIAIEAVDKALASVNMATSGLGSMTAGIPGTPAHDLARTLDTIKANIGFEELQSMRDNSPTGGALGQVTERELAFLQSTIANIEQSQSEQQLKENLMILREFIAGSQERRRAAFQQQYSGAQGAAPSAPAAPAGVDDILSGYGL